MQQQQEEPTTTYLKRHHNNESLDCDCEQDNLNRKKQKASYSGLYIDEAQFYTTKAENALKISDEYIQSEQLNLAFLELTAIVSKFGRQIKTWHEIYEQVAKRFITVGVELGRIDEINDALFSYRAICQSNLEIESLLNILGLYLNQIAKKTQKYLDQVAIDKSKRTLEMMDIE